MYKVVICDDERIIREGLKQAISWEDYHFHEVWLAKDGIEGLSLIREHQPDLVITDIRMPRMDGVELLEAIKDLPCQKIILSSYDDFEYMQAGIHHHVLDYLLKPIDSEQLNQRLAQFVPLAHEQKTTMTTTLPIFQPLMKLEYPDYYVNYVVQHIHHHYDQKWQSNALTTELGVSESYLMRIFK
ncbi:response regulator, partial [Staphylococcus pseudintermedius]|nr:response regulator [Staphylococcus pseudintermedius]